MSMRNTAMRAVCMLVNGGPLNSSVLSEIERIERRWRIIGCADRYLEHREDHIAVWTEAWLDRHRKPENRPPYYPR